MFTGPRDISNKRLRGAKAAGLGVSLLVSAALTAVALEATEHRWLAWISFLPIFAAVRWLRPPAAVLAGALWGGSLWVFCVAGPAPVLAASFWSLALLTSIPAVYAGLAALPGRPIGLNLLTLALGWTLVEASLHVHSPSGLREGLLIGSPGEGAHLHWLTRLLGYVSTAFLVACANASLVSILSNARLRISRQRSFARLPDSATCSSSQTTLGFQLRALQLAHPRAPPSYAVDQ